MLRYLRSIAIATCIAAVFLVAPSVRGASTSDDEMGRWKLDGSGGCYWDENDDGPNQCDPNNPDGRYKLDGSGGCYWEPYDFGDDQCTPGPDGGGSGGGLTPVEEEDGTQGAGTCIGSVGSMALASRGTYNGNVLVVTVSIDPALSSSAADAITDALNDWNIHTPNTMVRFVPGGASGGDLHFWRRDVSSRGGVAGTFNNWAGCGDGGPSGGKPSITKDVSDKNNRAEIAPLAAHEVGHNLGINHTPPGTSGVMAQLGVNILHPAWGLHPEDCNDLLRDRPGHGGTHTTVQPVDVQSAVECLSQMWQARRFEHYENKRYTKQVPAEKGGGFCEEIWYTQVTSSCGKVNGVSIGCTVTGVYQVRLVSTNCPA